MIVNDENVYKLSNIIRYSQLHKIKKETVAEHSFYVVWFTKRLCTKYMISDKIKLMALETALLHDIPEVITNDITYDVKMMLPEVPALLQPYEKEIINEHSMVAHNVLFDPRTLVEHIVKVLVKHADILSVLQYCTNEANLGNTNFISLKEATVKRLAISETELETLIDSMKKQS